jgi:peptidoglycan hydrolase-like protein with peptidoglycan-binding domain
LILKKGSKGKDVEELQRALKAVGFNVGTIDGDFGRATRFQVEAFQDSVEIHSDGIVGRETLSLLGDVLVKSGNSDLIFEIGDADECPEPDCKYDWVRVDADKVDGSRGYDRFYLREDASGAYNALRKEVRALGGVITSAGARRRLSSSKRSKSRSTKSMHYVGLAFDLALDSGMENPKKQRYAIENVGDRDWNVWCKTDNEEVPERTIHAFTYRCTRVPVTGRYFSFTELARKHGFEPIKARGWFLRGGKYTGAEWWHFQYERALEEGKSTFGTELLRMYDRSECEKFEHWDNSKGCVFGIDWF